MENLHIEDAALSDPNGEIASELPLSEKERQILDLYDQLEETTLEIGFLKAAVETPVDESVIVTDEDIQKAREELLEAKALYALRRNVTENVLIANPILKAVHAGEKATLAEQDLLPMIKTRDEFSVKLAAISHQTLLAQETLIELQRQNVVIMQRNGQDAASMMILAQAADAQKNASITDPEQRRELEVSEERLKIAKRKYRMMKGMASGIVAGSGLDWARNPDLRAIVLDNEDGEF